MCNQSIITRNYTIDCKISQYETNFLMMLFKFIKTTLFGYHNQIGRAHV